LKRRVVLEASKPFQRPLKLHKRRPKATIFCGVLLVAFYLIVFFAVRDPLPSIVQRLVGVANALLVMALAYFAVTELAKKHKTFSFLKWRKIDTGQSLGGVLGALVMLWWLSPFAPIKIGVPTVEDMSRLMADELTVVVLMLSDPNLAVIQSPLPPPQAVEMARRIPKDADPYSLAMRALANREFAEAERQLDQAEARNPADHDKILVSRGQVDLYARNYDRGSAWYQTLVDQAQKDKKPLDPQLALQAAAAHALCGNMHRAAELVRKITDNPTGQDVTSNILPIGLNLQAAISICQGNYHDAESPTQQAQLTWEKQTGEESASFKGHMAASRNNQAVLYASQPRKYAGAESQFQGAKDLWIEVYGEGHARVASSLNNLAVLYAVQARFDEAEHTFDSAITNARNSLPPGHPDLAISLNACSELLNTVARFPEAQRYADEGEGLLKGAGLRYLPQVAATTNAQAALQASRGQYTDAAVRYRRGLELAKRALPEAHPFIGATIDQLARVDQLRGQYSETQTLSDQAVQIFTKALGDRHPNVATALNTLGMVYLQQDRRADAQKAFKRAQEIWAKDSNDKLPEAARSLAGIAGSASPRQWRTAVGDYRRAIRLVSEAFGGAGEQPDEDVKHPLVAQYQHDLASLYTAQGSSKDDFAQAESLYKNALATREALLPDPHPETVATLSGYAELLRKSGQKEDAAAMKKRARLMRERLPKEGDS